jgi:hypothetical protein
LLGDNKHVVEVFGSAVLLPAVIPGVCVYLFSKLLVGSNCWNCNRRKVCEIEKISEGYLLGGSRVFRDYIYVNVKILKDSAGKQGGNGEPYAQTLPFDGLALTDDELKVVTEI